MQTLTIDNFLNKNDYSFIENLKENHEPFFDTEGVYQGEQTSTQQWINPTDDFAKHIKNKLNVNEYLKNNTIDGIQILRAIKPYDVHSDYIVQDNQVPLSNPKTHIELINNNNNVFCGLLIKKLRHEFKKRHPKKWPGLRGARTTKHAK